METIYRAGIAALALALTMAASRKPASTPEESKRDRHERMDAREAGAEDPRPLAGRMAEIYLVLNEATAPKHQ